MPPKRTATAADGAGDVFLVVNNNISTVEHDSPLIESGISGAYTTLAAANAAAEKAFTTYYDSIDLSKKEAKRTKDVYGGFNGEFTQNEINPRKVYWKVVKMPLLTEAAITEAEKPTANEKKKAAEKKVPERKAPAKKGKKQEEAKEAEEGDEEEAEEEESKPAPKAKTKSVAEQRKANATKASKPSGDASDLPQPMQDLLAGSGTALKGMNVVVTGVPPTLSRKQTEQLVENYGGHLTKSLSKNTGLVVVGNDAGPNKLEKIEELGLKTVDEDGLVAMLQKGGSGAGDDEEEEEEEKPKAKKQKRKA